uniref:Hexosyltransferase n=1 Tax=Evadne anonyx TaxID=141404 RepID=A0A9N6ZFD2_9CRUS|nr:EOG090X07IA [Evadne anonyx]
MKHYRSLFYDCIQTKIMNFNLKDGFEPSVLPITVFNYSYLKEAEGVCSKVQPNVLFIIKSARQHSLRRQIIRQTWGSEKRFPDVVIRTVFLIGTQLGNNSLDHILNTEDEIHKDLVQANFIDSYGNNTLKTMMGFKWAVQHCSHAQFIVFSDDDMYLSPLNILRFIGNPHCYPEDTSSNSSLDPDQNLYAGYVFGNSAPMRLPWLKWYISWDEYKFNLWPPYVTAGAYIVSRRTLLDLYYASLFTQFLRFDDVFLGLVALKAHIKLQHSSDFYFWKKPYTALSYKNVIASHGYNNPEELLNTWQEQKNLGHA